MNHFRLEEKQNKTSKAKKFPCSAASDSLVVPPRLIFHVKSSKTINPSSTNFFLHTQTLSLSLSLSLCVSQNSHTLLSLISRTDRLVFSPMAEGDNLFAGLAEALFAGSKPLSPADLLRKLRSEDSIRPALQNFYLILKRGVEASPEDGARLGLQSWNESQIQAVASIASALASASRSLSGEISLYLPFRFLTIRF